MIRTKWDTEQQNGSAEQTYFVLLFLQERSSKAAVKNGIVKKTLSLPFNIPSMRRIRRYVRRRAQVEPVAEITTSRMRQIAEHDESRRKRALEHTRVKNWVYRANMSP